MLKDKILMGVIIITIMSGVIYYSFPDDGVKIRIDKDQTSIYLAELYGRVVAREINSLWDGTTKMNRIGSSLKVEQEYDNITNISTTTRTTKYIRGPVIIDTYIFDGKLKDIADHPKEHIIDIYNASGYIYQWEVRDLYFYNGPTISGITSPQNIGKIKVEWDTGHYWSKIFKSKIIKVRWRIEEDHVTLRNKVTDPPSTVNLLLEAIDSNIDAETDSELNISATVSPSNLEVCIRSDHPDIPLNHSCGIGSTWFLWNVTSGGTQFTDGTTAKNMTYAAAGNQSVNFKQVRNNSEQTRSKIDITGYASTGTYAKNLIFDLDNDSITDASIWGELRGTQIYTNEFNGSVNTTTLIYNTSGVQSIYLKLPKNFNVTNATFNITGEQNTYAEQFRLGSVGEATDADGFRYIPYEPNVAYKSGNEIYIFGGNCFPTGGVCTKDGTYNARNTTVKVAIGETFGAITVREPVPYPAGNGACVIYDGSDFYIFGGYDGTNVQDDVYSYDPIFNNWGSALTVIPENKAWHSCIYKDGLVYLFSGYTTGVSWDNSSYAYNISADSWATLAQHPDGHEQGCTKQFNSTHMIVYGGTRKGSINTQYNVFYDIAGDSFSAELADIGSSLWHVGCGKVGDNIYAYGGLDGSSYNTEFTIYRYNVSADNWDAMDTVMDTWFNYGDCVEIDEHVACWGSGPGAGQVELQFWHYPNEAGIQVQNYVNTSYDSSVDLKDAVNIGEISSEINTELQTCTEDSDKYCTLRIWVQNLGAGNILFDALNITTDPNPINLEITNVTCSTSYCNQTLRIESSQKGIVQIDNINMTWKGTTNITFNASTDGNVTYDPGSETHIMTVYYSKFQRTLPYTWTDVIFIQASNANQSNVAAFGQTSTRPIVNVTSQAQDKTFNLSVKKNQTDTCLNITFDNSSNVSQGINLTTSYVFQNQFTTTQSHGYWIWGQLNECNASVSRYLKPQLQWLACCETCVGCP